MARGQLRERGSDARPAVWTRRTGLECSGRTAAAGHAYFQSRGDVEGIPRRRAASKGRVRRRGAVGSVLQHAEARREWTHRVITDFDWVQSQQDLCCYLEKRRRWVADCFAKRSFAACWPVCAGLPHTSCATPLPLRDL